MTRKTIMYNNRPFPSCLLPLCQNESTCKTIHMKMSSCLQVHFHENQTYFHKKGFARRLVLKQRLKVTRKRTQFWGWTIWEIPNQLFLTSKRYDLLYGRPPWGSLKYYRKLSYLSIYTNKQYLYFDFQAERVNTSIILFLSFLLLRGYC